MKKVVNYSKYFYLLGALFIGCLFFYITYKTPLCGDDWGYALNAGQAGAIESAVGFYTSWSGRFFSEVWCFFGAANKWFWDLLNPILFMVAFLGIYKLAHLKNKYILIPAVIIAIILSVDDNLRMETYTFMTGTIYTIPLALSFIYFMIMDKLFYSEIDGGKKTILLVLSNIILFYIGMTTENIAATMLVAIVIELVYAYFNKRKLMKYLWINLAFSAASFIIMRMSPGSTFRLLRDHAEWSNLSIFEKLANGYPSFIEFTFLKNDYLILFLSLTMILLTLFTKRKVSTIYRFSSISIYSLAIFSVFSFVLFKENNILLDPNSMFSMIFWPIYTANIFEGLFYLLENGPRKDKIILFFMVAGTANLVMMYSPIFGSRSAIYTVFYMTLVIALILGDLDISKYILLPLLALSLFVVVDRTGEYLYKYKLVGLRQNERLEVIKYYQDHPEVEEVWIPRFPIYTIHSGDVEIGDTYHFETFKAYYKLPQDADKIIFYYVEEQ